MYDQFFSGPIDRLKRQRKPDAKAKKPKPVTDEQLLAIVEELQAKIDKVYDFVRDNYKRKFFASPFSRP